MAVSPTPAKRLPSSPSQEYLRKFAKRLARTEGLPLARAQRRIAESYGFRNWAELMQAAAPRGEGRSPLSEAAARGDAALVRSLLAEGAAVEGEPHEIDSPLYLACDSEAPADVRLATAAMLTEAGAFTRRFCEGGVTALHAAARRGPASLVELLLRSGALIWQEDEQGRRPYDYAKEGTPLDRDRVLSLCADGPKIADPEFRAAVDALQAGDADRLAMLLDANPALLREAAVQPEIGPPGYFSDPKLFWFVANNPTLVPQPPANIVEIAELMIERGVAQEDLDYTLGLVMTNGLLEPDCQIALVRTLTAAGAVATPGTVIMGLGHGQTRPILWLLEHGYLRPSAVTDAGLGRTDSLREKLGRASDEEKANALDMAVVNRQQEATRLCLEAGADPNRFMACHAHSTPLHQAAFNGDIGIMKMLVAHGARRDVEDTVWRGTPLGWALHCEQEEAAAYLRSLG